MLEYYNLATDKFKKHVIPLDRAKSVKENVDEIYANPKHGMLLGKVERKYLESVIKEESYMSNVKPQGSNLHVSFDTESHKGGSMSK